MELFILAVTPKAPIREDGLPIERHSRGEPETCGEERRITEFRRGDADYPGVFDPPDIDRELWGRLSAVQYQLPLVADWRLARDGPHERTAR